MNKDEFKWKLRYGDLANAAKAIDELDEHLRKHDNIEYNKWEPIEADEKIAHEWGFDGSDYEVHLSKPKELEGFDLWAHTLDTGDGFGVEVTSYGDDNELMFVQIGANKKHYEKLSVYVYKAQWLLWAADNPDELIEMIVEKFGQ